MLHMKEKSVYVQAVSASRENQHTSIASLPILLATEARLMWVVRVVHGLRLVGDWRLVRHVARCRTSICRGCRRRWRRRSSVRIVRRSRVRVVVLAGVVMHASERLYSRSLADVAEARIG